jgi:hypothetical protein
MIAFPRSSGKIPARLHTNAMDYQGFSGGGKELPPYRDSVLCRYRFAGLKAVSDPARSPIE